MQGIYCNLLVVLIYSGLKERYTLQVSSLWLMWKMGGGGWVQYLDENKQLILAILDNQNLGKLNECATWVNCGASFCKYTIWIFIWFLGFRFHMGNVSEWHSWNTSIYVSLGWVSLQVPSKAAAESHVSGSHSWCTATSSPQFASGTFVCSVCTHSRWLSEF